MTPDELRAQAEQQEPPVARSFLEWVAAARAAGFTVEQIVAALRSGVAEPLLAALNETALRLETRPAAAAGGASATAEVQARIPAGGLKLEFNQQDPLFEKMVYDHGVRAVVDVTEETKQAVRRIVADARRYGLHPYQFAPTVAATVGLNARGAVAVGNYYRGQLEHVPPATAEKRAVRYAGRLLRARAKTIARTETMRAANLGRVAGYEQAATAGLVPRERARLEWLSVQDNPEEVCFQLNGKRVPLGDTFDGLMPPAHPNCRCVVVMVVE